MLNNIIASALRNRAIVITLAFMIASYGLFTATQMPIDVLPDMNRPIVTIMTEAPGMVPEEVERLVTWPLEQVMNGATGVYRVRSVSGTGLSVVYIEFEWDTDIYRDRQIVAEKLQLVSDHMPDNVQPAMAPISSIMGQIQLIGFRAIDSKIDPVELRRIVDRDIKPRIRSLSGVAQVITIGGQPTELQVSVDAEKLRNLNLSLQDVRNAVDEANVSIAGGYINIGTKGPLVTVPGLISSADDLSKAVIKADPIRPLRISDVAEVHFGGTAVPTGSAGVNGEPGVIMVVSKQPGVDTLTLTSDVEKELDTIYAEFEGKLEFTPNLFQQAAFIERAIDNVLEAVWLGALLVVIVLFAFLLNFRTTIITLTAIPLSIACTAILFEALGLSINTMTLGGIAVAIGTLVDDAIVDVENVFKRLRQNAQLDSPKSPLLVVFLASSEIRKPVMYGTLLVTVVYVPLFFLSGIEGRLFAPIGLAYILSVFASLFVALTITPVTCYYLLGVKSFKSSGEASWLIRKLNSKVSRLIRWSLSSPQKLLSFVLALVMASGIIFLTRGSSFLPDFNEGSYQINLVLDPDTSLASSEEYGQKLEKLLSTIDGIENIGRRTGRAAGDEHAMPVSITETIVTVDPNSNRSREDLLREIRDRLQEHFPGVVTATEQPLKHLLDALLSGVTASVAIKISGEDLDVLRSSAREVESAIQDISGIRDLYVEPQTLIDQVEIKPMREALARQGLSVKSIADTISLAMGTQELSEIQVGKVRYPIVVRLKESQRSSLEKLKGLYLKRDDGKLVLISDVAKVGLVKTPNNINREKVERRVVVQHNVEGRSLSEVVAEVKRAIAPIQEKLTKLPGSYAIRISGQFEAQEKATQLIYVLSLFSLAAMLMILVMHFRSIRIAALILVSRPIAFIGAIALVIITQQIISVATLVGLIALLGVSTRNAILLADHYLHLLQEKGSELTFDILIQAGQERMVPILMTALTSGIALVPLVLSPDEPGRELLYPVATVIIGGLFSSTLLDFVVMPCLFWVFGQKEAKRIADLSSNENFEEQAKKLLGHEVSN